MALRLHPDVDPAGPGRNRRERPRMSDITRAVDKVLEEPSMCWEEWPGGTCVPAGSTMEIGQAGTTQTLPYLAVGADKNSPESLKTLRWEIYDLLDRYGADYGRTIKFTLMQEVERLFNLYTHS
jgi:hypothetical protein